MAYSTKATTTFVEADPSTFRSIVQQLTGSKLHERRRQAVKKLEISKDSQCGGKRERGTLVSPVSTLDFLPLLSLASRAKRTRTTAEEEEKDHRRGADSEPELLALFPLHSPRENSHS
ncbi:hypothetical protein V6N13_063176 [Hibiscus sabdariffa]|uniref:VQ domain-containing protein n=1 Tax=Hibiscus sabdariffa TaxID=183260 RepID=A0ABR2C4C5_9ROSI